MAALLAASMHSVAATQTATLSIPAMNCASCPITVKMALSKVAGVTDVKTSLAQRQTTVVFDAAKTSIDAIRQATKEAGYPSTVVSK